jgi:hypothetical protein
MEVDLRTSSRLIQEVHLRRSIGPIAILREIRCGRTLRRNVEVAMDA